MVWRLDHRLWFPDPAGARADGLIAVGGDLSPARLLLGYRSGVFPWSAGPVTWWSPDPRAVFELDRIHVSRSLARTLRSGGFEVTFDRGFRAVIRGCAAAGRGGQATWITSEFIDAYETIHRGGHAHSIEVWQDGQLAGGLYGVALGAFFAGESMFHRVTDASKVAVVRIAESLRERGFQLFDTQMVTPVTRSLGALEIPRSEYLRRLSSAIEQPNCWPLPIPKR